ncbi:hypothetical protein A5686_20640 [Mycobacterium sp. E2479]|nr:hypothetical protein A5686_20640 [Mycobacterium sp. E2479]
MPGGHRASVDGADPLHPAPPRSRSPRANGADPLHPAPPRSRSPRVDGADPLHPAPPRSRSPRSMAPTRFTRHRRARDRRGSMAPTR